MYTQKDTPNHRAPLVNVETTSPLQLVCMDYLTHIIIHQHILIKTDHFTRFAQAIPIRNQHEQLLKSCATTILYIMVSTTTFIQTKEQTWNPKSLRNCAESPEHQVSYFQLPSTERWYVLDIQPHTAQYVRDFCT